MAALPYMQLYVADYLADTAHLTAAQHGGYLLLIFNYWQRGKALNNSNGRLANVARMSNEEWEQNKHAIAEFFDVQGDEWIHHRIEADLAAISAKSTKAQAAGRASAEKRFNKRSTTVEQTLNHTDTDTDTEELQLPLSSGDDVQRCPGNELVDLYHELMPNNPRVKVANPARKGAIKARWREAAALTCEPFGYTTRSGGLAAWRQFFEICAESKFLTGQAQAQPGKPPFVANIDFIFSPSGFAKILENTYHRDAT